MMLPQTTKEQYEGLCFILTQAAKPSVYFEVLRRENKMDKIYPELLYLLGVPQWDDSQDVWTHTMRALDTAALYRNTRTNPCGFMIAVLMHDIGRPFCTFKTLCGEVKADGYEEKGVSVAKTILSRFQADTDMENYVTNMIQLHAKPHMFFRMKANMDDTNRLLAESVSPTDLISLSLVDTESKLPKREIIGERRFWEERLQIYIKKINF